MESERCGLNLDAGGGADGVEGPGVLSSLLEESRFERRFWLSAVSSLPAAAPAKPFNHSLLL